MSEDIENRIRLRAYAIWVREGQPDDRHIEHWLQAEREIAQESAQPPAAGSSGGDSPAELEQRAPTSPHPAMAIPGQVD
jgi:hypothetical protein